MKKYLALPLLFACFIAMRSFAQDGFTDRTRALYIMDISKYVDWPAGELEKSEAFTIGILSKSDKLYWELENLTKTRTTIQGKNATILLFREVSHIEKTQVLFINRSEGFEVEKILQQIRGNHTLLISEGYEFRKSMLNFVVVNNQPRFEANEELLNSEGLKVNQLFLAQAVKTREDWEALFKVTEEELKEEKVITEQQRIVIANQQKQIAIQKALLDSLDKEIARKQQNIREKEKVLVHQGTEIDKQRSIIVKQQTEVEKREKQLDDQLKTIETREKTILEQSATINEQESRIRIQLKEIEKQKLITYFVSIALLLVILVAYFIFVNYRNKKKANQILEAKNKQILAQKEELRIQRDLAENQRDQIAYQKKHITDSIQYAKRIQTALLPSLELFSDRIDHFVLYKPRDIVSGDFYWVSTGEDRQVIIAADCTGHGVPGAFMSMLGISLLNEIVNNKGIIHPDEVLNALRSQIIESLKQAIGGSEVKDGMDMAVCMIDFKKDILEFAGANNPLYFISNGELIQIKGDKMPVAVYDTMENFTLHKIKLKKGDSFYTFSDGYVDQFGGPLQKKFLAKKFRELLLNIQDKSMMEQGAILNEVFEEWKNDVDQVDDVSIIGIRY